MKTQAATTNFASAAEVLSNKSRRLRTASRRYLQKHLRTASVERVHIAFDAGNLGAIIEAPKRKMSIKRSASRLATKKCGIHAIDAYYEQLSQQTNVQEHIEKSEIERYVRMIKHHLTANKFPACELQAVQNILEYLIEQAKSKTAKQLLLSRVESYLAFIKEFTRLENQIKNLYTQRQQLITQLLMVSQNQADIKKFQTIGPRLMLSLR